jgi:predicted nucleic acid-binding protein
MLDSLCASPDYNLFINDIVISEVIYHLISYNSNTSPNLLKRKGLLKDKINNIDFDALFIHFTHINANIYNISAVTSLMADFNLLSNDALIFHCCTENGIKYLATFDNDFEFASSQFGISIFSSIEQLTI